MKTTYNHLPQEKQTELNRVIVVIKEKLPAQLIILFGSYARGQQVSDKYVENGITYEYQSDYDILVVMDSESQAIAKETEKRWKQKIKTVAPKNTPLNIIFHGIEYLNAEIEQGNYFFTDILKDGVLLYDSGKHKLASPLSLNEKQRREKAKMYFEMWFKDANDFFEDFERNFNLQKYKHASFMLHQATERFFMTVLLVYIDYKPKIHDLDQLNRMVCKLDSRFKSVFPRTNAEEERLFNLLKRAYIDSRYKLDYEIERGDLEWLSLRVGVLRGLTENCCKSVIKPL